MVAASQALAAHPFGDHPTTRIESPLTTFTGTTNLMLLLQVQPDIAGICDAGISMYRMLWYDSDIELISFETNRQMLCLMWQVGINPGASEIATSRVGNSWCYSVTNLDVEWCPKLSAHA